MKKLLAILTVMCMVLTTLVVPTVVFADGNNGEPEPPIAFYSDEECTEPIPPYLNANKSKTAAEQYFYVKYPKDDQKPLQYKVGSRHMVPINEEDTVTVWRMETPNSSEISYNKYGEDYEPVNNELVTTLNSAFSTLDIAKAENSALKYVDVQRTSSITFEGKDYYVSKVMLKPHDIKDNEFRGSEDFLFMFSVDGINYETMEVNFGIDIEYDPKAINNIDSSSTAFYELCGLETSSEIEDVRTSGDGLETALFARLGSLSSGRSDLRHGIGSELWVDLNDGYQITGIYDTLNDEELPYTAVLTSYFKVFDGTTEVKIETIEGEEGAWGSMSLIGSGEDDDVILASAYNTNQELAKGTAENYWAETEEYWKGFSVGNEDVSQFYAWCEENGYTSELMGTHLLYQIYMPVEDQCKIKIETEKASSLSSFENADSKTNVRFSGEIADFSSNKVDLSNADKAAVNKKLSDYYKDGAKLMDVYEFEGEIDGSANIAIPVADADNYEIVWLTEDTNTEELNPVPMLSVETAANDAKVVPTGHFSMYALVSVPTETTVKPDNSPNTGDDFSAIPYIAVTVIALAGVAVAMFRRKTVK